MKWINVLCAMLLFAGFALAEDMRVNDQSIVFLYESRAEIPAPDHHIANVISVDYRRAQDEFTRYELMERIKPVIDKRKAEAGKATGVYLIVGSNLGEYDFEEKGFPTGMGDGTFVNFDNNYTVTFVNGEVLGFLPVPLESARALAGQLRRSRRAAISIYGDVVSAKEQELKLLHEENSGVKCDEDRGGIGFREGKGWGQAVLGKSYGVNEGKQAGLARRRCDEHRKAVPGVLHCRNGVAGEANPAELPADHRRSQVVRSPSWHFVPRPPSR